MNMRKIAIMHRVYGRAPGHTCEDCPALACYMSQSGRRYWKCLAYGNSPSAASDWTKSWPACGLWGRGVPRGHVPVMKRSDDVPIEGQISMFEEVKE